MFAQFQLAMFDCDANFVKLPSFLVFSNSFHRKGLKVSPRCSLTIQLKPRDAQAMLSKCSPNTEPDPPRRPRRSRDTPETLPRQCRDTPETLPRHCRDTPETLPRHLRLFGQISTVSPLFRGKWHRSDSFQGPGGTTT